MAISSNLYAEKIYQEHPIAIWHLDDKTDYVSLIPENKRIFNGSTQWTIIGNASIKDPLIDGDIDRISPLPFTQNTLNYIRINDPSTSISFISPELINFDDLNSEVQTFAIGCWVYTTSSYLTKLSIGYTYSGLANPIFNEFSTSVKNNWFFVSGTFNIPTGVSSPIKVVIKIDATNSSVDPMDYEFYFDGITVGQLCEEYHAESLGVQKLLLPSEINTSVDGAIVADAYGLANKNGYYIIENNNLVAKQGAIPLVYGSSGSVELVPHEEIVTTQSWSQTNDNSWQYLDENETWSSLVTLDQSEFIIAAKPSMIFPGFGFLNEIGRYQDYTVEFWVNIDSNATSPKRIFGPISSTDGLYVETGFLTLKIDNNFISHYVGEWFRPMLIHIRMVKNQATLLVNGEEVGQIVFNSETISLPSKLSEDNKQNDWLGFYAYKNNVVDPIILGSFSIFSYAIPTLVAKSHFVYGQGVPLSSEIIDSYYGGTSTEIDYSFSQYNKNKTYPGNLSWQEADIDNLIANNSVLTTPNYFLPNFNLGDKTILDLENDCKVIQDDGERFFTLKPNSTWNSINSSIYFNDLSFIQSKINTFYGIFEFTESNIDQTLFSLFKDSSNYFSVQRNALSSNIEYIFCFNGITNVVGTQSIPLHEFVAGINIDLLLSNNIEGLFDFFANVSYLKLYIGNDFYNNKFTGKIYSFGISSLKNSLEIEHHFNSNGIALINSYSSLLPHIATYTLLPFYEYGKFYIDISAAGYWRDYIPISSLMSSVYNTENILVDDIDFIQFNINYPAISDIAKNSQTYWINNSETNTYDTSQSSIRSYVAFDYIVNGSSQPDSYYTDVEANYSKILDLNENDWFGKRFEVIDNYLIYPNKSQNLKDLIMIYFVNFKIKSLLKKKPFLRKLDFIGKTLNYNGNNFIGTKYGNNIYPFKQVGFYNDNKGKNPILISKEGLPYLYLTRKNGIELRDGTNNPERGISIPISSTNINSYYLSAIQMFFRSDLYAFPETPVKIFEIVYKDDIIDFYVKANSSKANRGVIFAKLRSTGNDFSLLNYYINGRIVRQPVINIQEWYVLGIYFDIPLSFNNYAGKINLKYLTMFNNISLYEGNPSQIVQRIEFKNWQEVDDEGTWEYWKNKGDWSNVLIKSQNSVYAVDPKNIYKTYIGGNKFIVDDYSNGLKIKTDSIQSYTDVSWENYIVVPA